ncbi:MAG: transposase [Flavobacteriales bacterium]
MEDDIIDPFFDEHDEVNVTRRNLPHWSQAGKLYFVTWRLADSLPQEQRAQLEADRAAWIRKHGHRPIKEMSPGTKEEWYRLFHRRVQQWLDAGHGSCLLRRSEARGILIEAFDHFEGKRYRLGSYAIASNHVHVLVAPLPGFDLSGILHSWKSFTANEINKACGGSGRLWMDENFDRLVRGPEHLERIERYIARHDRQGAYVERRDLIGQ